MKNFGLGIVVKFWPFKCRWKRKIEKKETENDKKQYIASLIISSNYQPFRIDKMDNNQQLIFEWLKEQDQSLSSLYEAAVRMLEDSHFPGRKRMVCHAVREIRNRLPETVGIKGVRKQADYKKEVGELIKLYRSEGIQSVYQKDNEGHEPVLEYRVSRKFMEQVDRLVHEHTLVKERKEHNARQLLLALETENKKWEGTLGPIVELWIEETEWFVQRAHVGKEINDKELIERFKRFEDILLSLKGVFYEGMDKIKEIVESVNSSGAAPTKDEIINAVALLGSSNYRIYFFKELKNPYWLEPLKEQGFFKIPDDPSKGESYDRWLEEWYLDSVSEREPEKVLDVIKDVKCENPYVRSGCIKCLLKMPLEIAIRGNDIIKKILNREFTKGDVYWPWIGQNCAKLMVKVLEKFPDSAFEIAWTLLDAWVSENEPFGRDIVAKFTKRDYKKLMLEYYSKVWGINPERAIWVLIKILGRCIKELDKDGKGEQGYDASRYFGYGLQLGDLNEIDMKHPSIKTTLIKGICEAGKVLINKEPAKVSKLLDFLEETNRVIFLRIAMYLLRFVQPGIEKERINRFIANKEYFKEYNPCWHEHRWLFNDKFDDIEEDIKKAFLEWVDEDKYGKEKREEITKWTKENDKEPPNFEKMENFAKAEELYIVREKFKDEYERYKKAAGVESDSVLSRRKRASEARSVSPKEGTPLTSEEMAKLNPEQVLDYVSDANNYKEDKKVNTWRSPADGLAATLREDAKKRPNEYLACDSAKLMAIPEIFLTDLFYGIGEAVRDGSFAKENWERFLDVSLALAGQKGKEEGYKSCFHAIVGTLRDSFSERENTIELNEKMAEQFSQILATLVQFPTGNMNKYLEESHQKDPVQLMCVVVAGEALSVSVPLGIACKNRFPEYWDNELKKVMRDCWDFVLSQIREPGINCVFGLEFSRLHWLDEEWVQEKLDVMFGDDLWDEVWETYASWGRPSPEGFDLLLKRGLYALAVERIDAKSRFKFAKGPEKGLVEHLMTGYFNGWISFEDLITMQFFSKASADLRSEAARFLSTGFSAVNEENKAEEKEKVAARIEEYWRNRLTAIKKSGEINSEEAVELAGWVCDSVLPAPITLELVEQSLELSGGKIGELRDARDFIEGICRLEEGNELLALRCLKKAATDENIHMTWSGIQEPLESFLETMVDKTDEIRIAAREVADVYGRYNPDKFQAVWEKLK